MNIKSIENRLVDLCRQGKFEHAQEELYASDAASIEPEGLPPGRPGNATAMAAIREKGRQFQAAIEAVHGVSLSEPVVAGTRFSVAMTLDVTYKGRGRTKLDEICLFRVQDGKIVREQFSVDPACLRLSFKLRCSNVLNVGG